MRFHQSRSKAGLLLVKETPIPRLGIQLNSYALTRMSRLSASIVAYGMFKTIITNGLVPTIMSAQGEYHFASSGSSCPPCLSCNLPMSCSLGVFSYVSFQLKK